MDLLQILFLIEYHQLKVGHQYNKYMDINTRGLFTF